MKSKKPFFNFKNYFLTHLILLLTFPSIAFAQSDDVTECPYFTVFSDDSTGVAFSLLSTNVDATISGVIANVIVEQTYFNAGDSIIDATYVFPMSTNAAIYAMEMVIDDRVVKAEIRRNAEAEEIFDSANEAGLTATLLEQERPNVFQMSLANIYPGDSLKVRMVYTELLVPSEGVYQFVFPNIVGPRFTANGEPWVAQSINDFFPVSETELNIRLKINAGMQLHAVCKSHNAPFDYQGRSGEIILNTTPGDDFIVDYTLDDNHINTGLLLYESENEEENFFLSMIQPAKPEVEFNSPPREYIFIMDVSGSMKGEPIEISKRLITDLLTNLNSGDKFNIIFFAGGSSILSPHSLDVSLKSLSEALEMIDNINAGGSTRLLSAMQTALDMEGTADYSRTFVILTDGYVTVEKEAYELIRQNLNEANFFSFGIGSSMNRFIIEGIAYVGEGEAFAVTNQVDANEMANTFKRYIEHPVLTNIELFFEGIDVYDVEPLTIPDVFAERPIIVYGKYHTPAEGNIGIVGDYANGNISETLSFSDYRVNAADNIALKYLWARKKIKLMSDYGIASDETDELSLEEEITQLGLKYSLITNYTSFVAVDSSALSGNGSGEEDDEFPLVGLEDDFSAEKGLIEVMGTITGAEQTLRIKLDEFNVFKYQNLSLQITSVNGHIISQQKINVDDVEDILSISLGGISSGMYFISILSDSQILDTQKFVIR